MKSLLRTLIFLFLSSISFVHAQQEEILINKSIDITIVDKSLVEVMYRLEEEHGISFMFNPSIIPYYKFNKEYKDIQIYELINTLCDGSFIKAVVYNSELIVLVDFEKANRAEIERTKLAWENKEYSYPINEKDQSLSISNVDASSNVSKGNLELTLIDNESKQPIIGAVIFKEDLSFSVNSDINGKALIPLETGVEEFIVKYLGYRKTRIDVRLDGDYTTTILLEKSSLQLEEIEISAKGESANIEQSKVGVASLSTQQLESIPQITGEVDLIKSLEILPGVTTAGDLSSGFNVRGGRVDESLVLFNDAIIFNPTHVVGFISAFNADIIESADLYKGYLDSEFGNRSSAVLDIQGNYGNSKKLRLKSGIGTSMLKATLDGPVRKNLTMAVGVRGSFSDYILQATGIPELKRSSTSFYDLYGALKYTISSRHKLKASSYYSGDKFLYNENFGFDWSNFFINTTLDSNWGPSLFSSIKLTRGSYSNQQFSINTSDSYSFINRIVYNKARVSISKYLSKDLLLKFGIEYIDYRPDPEQLLPNIEGSTTLSKIVNRNGSLSISPYVSTRINPAKWFSLEAGLRYANYLAKGNATVYEYESEEPLKEFISGTKEIEKGEVFSRYAALEPRVSMNFKLRQALSLKVGYANISQNAQQLTLGNTSIPTDVWIFSNNYLAPRNVDQLTGAIHYYNKNARLKTSIGFFRKTTQNFFVLKDFADIIANPHLETETLQARQKSNGVEFQLEKSSLKWNVFGAYTYSKTQFQSDDPRGAINRGDWYNGDIDIPHQANLIVSYKIVPTFSTNLSYVFKSGRPLTGPIGSTTVDETLVPLYGDRNAFRIPAYSRMDLSFNLDMRKMKKDGLRSNFTFGIYNLLGTQNAFNVFFRTSTIGNLQAYKFSVIGRSIPSITWNIVLD